MKKKGFTLIELLAVIVILAIIALIATPIVMNIINDSKKGAAERSADNYIDAVETKVTSSLMDPSNKIEDGIYKIDSEGNLCSMVSNLEGGNCPSDEVISIDMSGTKPTSGIVIIDNGKVYSRSSFNISGYPVEYNNDTNKYEVKKVVYRVGGSKVANASLNDSEYTTDPSELEESPNYYLKHMLDKDNKITESYACAIYNNTEICLKGGSGTDYTENVKILQDIDESITEVDCGFDVDSFYCYHDSFSFDASSDGMVDAGDSASGECYVYVGGNSICVSY